MTTKEKIAKALELGEQISSTREELEEKEKALKEKQERARAAFEAAQQKATNELEIEKRLLKGAVEFELKENDALLKDGVFISVGDFARALADFFGLNEDDIEVRLHPIDPKVNQDLSTEYRREQIKAKEIYMRKVSATFRISESRISYEFTYLMDYNMPQADGLPFIDHCYAETRPDIDDDFDCINSLSIYTEDYDNIFIRIPYKTLAMEARKDADGAIPVGKKEYFWNIPFYPFKTVVLNCIEKQNCDAKQPYQKQS